MQKPVILFPKGGGGSWLANLIWHLENNNWDLPAVDRIFDHEPKGSIMCCHADFFRGGSFWRGVDRLIFSSGSAVFNHYVNEIEKIMYGIHRMARVPVHDQVQIFSDKVKHCTTNQEYQNDYYNYNDLDYRLVFCNPAVFAQRLFDLLDQYQIKHTKNYKYVEQSAKHYQSTCVDPAAHIGNLDSVMWLAFCHSQLVTEPVSSARSLDEFKKKLIPLNQQCIDQVSKISFLWPK
jgi:hypothetical protein